MFEFFRNVVGISVPIFVISTMLNVGLTNRPKEVLGYLKNRRFVVKMIIANFVLVPVVMITLLRVTSFDPPIQAGLLVFSLCAGAPFLIKLTQRAEQHVALGAAVMVLLMVLTVGYVPLILPRFLPGIAVDAWAIGRQLLQMLLFPMAIGMVGMRFLPSFGATIQPAIGLLANVALGVVIVATLIGYLPNMLDILGTGALLVGLGVVLAAFGVGYGAGYGEDRLEDVGGLGTAQRNTAAGLIIATQNFTSPDVLVVLTLVNMLGIIMLLGVARLLSRDNKPAAEVARD